MVILAISVIVVLMAALIWLMFLRGNQEVNRVLNEVIPDTVQKASEEPKPTAVEGRYLFNGTAVLARAVERDAGGDLSQPFSKMYTFKPKQYDAMTLDWECPSTDDIIPWQTQIDSLLFNCHKKWLPNVKKHFQIVSLANNHSGDLGEESFVETQKNLNAAGIQTYGNYNPAKEKDVCEIVALPVRVQMPDNTQEKGTLPIAFCAWHYFFRTPLPGEIEVMERYQKIMPVFGFMHAGAEYYATAAPDQVSLAKKIIDGGAEFVIGNSPHWVQNGEVYKGKPIFYSTGNFIFDQIDYETMRGLSIDVRVNVPYDENVAKWLKLGKVCKTLNDDCIEQAEQQKLSKFDIDLKYDVVGSSGGVRKVATKADPTLQKAIEERVGWSKMKAQLESAGN
jgi:poly-gamma-glutamate synthesis protein (capsule biosynthesis protein)